MHINFSFNTIYFIESLRHTDYKTGQILYDDLIRRRTNEYGIHHSEFFSPVNKADFLNAFKIITDKISTGYFPFIHLELHGSKDGVELTSGEFLTWNELGNETRKINVITQNNTIVSVAACCGAYFIKSIDVKIAAPFAGSFGPMKDIYPVEIETDFYKFFEVLLVSSDFNSALDKLNELNVNYNFVSSEELFEDLYNKLETVDFNFKTIESRNWVNELVKRVFATGLFDNQRKKDIKNDIRTAILKNKDAVKKESKQIFLMK